MALYKYGAFALKKKRGTPTDNLKKNENDVNPNLDLLRANSKPSETTAETTRSTVVADEGLDGVRNLCYRLGNIADNGLGHHAVVDDWLLNQADGGHWVSGGGAERGA
ncbi:hypothetical protein HPB50_013074 [Hyalomma asiaticum]|uniref:Uncharacterized protein n=1 Tax=Hyalomma asiaticum TaxID=266040 RepID=A0ACB7TJN6_HYAAI|nr:hypothetical protein HPB50_013074 [Hyalomma asiaticum]